MEQWEAASSAARQPGETEAICWECGEKTTCFEYIVCCTGTVFHLCPACETRVQAKESAAETCPKPNQP